MERDYRLFVKNLPLDIKEETLQKLFKRYATINKIDLKEKKDFDDKLIKFAFINVTTTDQKLNSCFQDLNNEKINGFNISVELAKESFLDRLKRERTENKKEEKVNVPINNEPIEFNHNNINSNNFIKPKHKQFSELDLSAVVEAVEKSKKTVKEERIKVKEVEEEVPSFTKAKVQKKFDNGDTSYSNDYIKPKKNFVTDNFESNHLEEDQKYKRTGLKKSDSVKTYETRVFEKPVISESEKKRLESLKQKKQAFKTQEQTIRNALKLVDNNKSNNKIVFDDDIDLKLEKKDLDKKENKQKALFDSGDEDEEMEWNEDALDAKAKLKNKLLKLQTNIGNDKRFVLDERFLDDEDKDKKKEENASDSEIVDEKKWQLELLGSVLGKPITTPTADSNETIKRKNMIRYDPTANNHQDFEVTVDKTKSEKPVKKKKKPNPAEVEEEPSVPISKEVFYDVSEKLVDSLKQNEGFSLLKAFGRDNLNEDNKDKQTYEAENIKDFQFNFDSKKAFKYDSSDDEGGNEEINEKAVLKPESTMSRQKDHQLFSDINDVLLAEAEQFLTQPIVQDEEAFKSRRRELKTIVRSKIRNNMKKTIPWNKRKVRKMHKKK